MNKHQHTNIRTAVNENVNGATFISMTTSTSPTLTGGEANPFKGRVQKVMTGANVMVFQNKNSNGYMNMIRRRLTSEGKNPDAFKLSDRAWGTRIPNTPFVEHKGGHYLEVIFLNAGEVHFEVDGVITDAEDIAGLTYTPTTAHQGGLNDKVIIRSFKIESIRSLTIAGETYTNLVYLN